ncbi:hypothetical protein DdX_17105 [Ditylenchus destructor]|uniref:Uncharacterized protein n=1 Tax=Ditylenchus destructor TaxID=166010 RepID=A0AAD4MS21_9BILA|nr:hypothetical protein DdX_17105 [Ditylenchus destructor]
MVEQNRAHNLSITKQGLCAYLCMSPLNSTTNTTRHNLTFDKWGLIGSSEPQLNCAACSRTCAVPYELRCLPRRDRAAAALRSPAAYLSHCRSAAALLNGRRTKCARCLRRHLQTGPLLKNRLEEEIAVNTEHSDALLNEAARFEEGQRLFLSAFGKLPAGTKDAEQKIYDDLLTEIRLDELQTECRQMVSSIARRIRAYKRQNCAPKSHKHKLAPQPMSHLTTMAAATRHYYATSSNRTNR